jgi:hypothetical protein
MSKQRYIPGFKDEVLTYYENHGEPLIEAAKQASLDLYAVDWGGGITEFQLDEIVNGSPGPMTVRKYARQYFGGEQGYLDAYCCERDGIEVDFDDIQTASMVEITWEQRGSPMAKAYRLLENLDLGPEFESEDAVGQLDFVDCPNMCSSYRGVQTEHPVSISLLQKRLNELNTGIRISVVEVS